MIYTESLKSRIASAQDQGAPFLCHLDRVAVPSAFAQGKTVSVAQVVLIRTCEIFDRKLQPLDFSAVKIGAEFPRNYTVILPDEFQKEQRNLLSFLEKAIGHLSDADQENLRMRDEEDSSADITPYELLLTASHIHPNSDLLTESSPCEDCRNRPDALVLCGMLFHEFFVNSFEHAVKKSYDADLTSQAEVYKRIRDIFWASASRQDGLQEESRAIIAEQCGINFTPNAIKRVMSPTLPLQMTRALARIE